MTPKTIDDLHWQVSCKLEAIHPGDLYGDAMGNKIIKAAKDNPWEWATVTVTGTYEGITVFSSHGCVRCGGEYYFLSSRLYKTMQKEVLRRLQGYLDRQAEKEVKV